MTTDQRIEAHFERERARREAPVAKPDDATTPQQKLVRAAETGRFEAIVAAAQPAEPPKMVTPEEREAELRAAGKAVEDTPKPKPKRKPRKKKPALEPGMPTEPTPGMQWAEEHLRRRPRGSRADHDRPPQARPLPLQDRVRPAHRRDDRRRLHSLRRRGRLMNALIHLERSAAEGGVTGDVRHPLLTSPPIGREGFDQGRQP